MAVLAQTESLFALANGHIGWPGSLDEGEPHGLPGSYLNDVYELRPLPYAEPDHGYPAAGQTVVNVTKGKLISLRGRPPDLQFHPSTGSGPGSAYDVRHGRLIGRPGTILDTRRRVLCPLPAVHERASPGA